MVKHQCCMSETPSSNPSTTKKKKDRISVSDILSLSTAKWTNFEMQLVVLILTRIYLNWAGPFISLFPELK
jgi:hypothetical protein